MEIVSIAPGFIIGEPQEALHQGLIHIEGANTMERFVKVLAVGPTFSSEFGGSLEPPCKVGDVIWFTGAHVTETQLDGTFKAIPFTDVIAVVAL